MKAVPLPIPDVIFLESKVFTGERGFLHESFNQSSFEKATNLSPTFVQGNKRGILRGLHYQMSPKARGKLARVVPGKAFDVAVNIRKSSPSFGYWIGEILASENKEQLWIHAGFSHGSRTLSTTDEFLYATTQYNYPTHELCTAGSDSMIGFGWPTNFKPSISTKGQQYLIILDAEVFI